MTAVAFNHFTLRADAAMTRQLRDFYVGVVGMTEGWRPTFPFPGHWLYLGEQAVLHLVEDETAKHLPGARRGALDHVAFTGSGLAGLEKRLQQRGIAYRRATVPGTSQVQVFVTDPSGNGVEFNFAGSDA